MCFIRWQCVLLNYVHSSQFITTGVEYLYDKLNLSNVFADLRNTYVNKLPTCSLVLHVVYTSQWSFCPFQCYFFSTYIQGRRRQLKSGTAKVFLRTNFKGMLPRIFFSLYHHTHIFTFFRVIVLHIFKKHLNILLHDSFIFL